MAARLKVLAIAVATGRIGYVFWVGGDLLDWGLSRKASKSTTLTTKQTKKWINTLKPDVVVTEKLSKHSRKGPNTKALIEAIANVAGKATLFDVVVPRIQSFKNKYDEAKHLVQLFPEMRPWTPRKPRLWETEPRKTIIFEALALGLVFFDGSDQFMQYKNIA